MLRGDHPSRKEAASQVGILSNKFWSSNNNKEGLLCFAFALLLSSLFLLLSHIEYLKDGLKHMRLKFYIEGSEPGVKGTVHTESKEVGILPFKGPLMKYVYMHKWCHMYAKNLRQFPIRQPRL